MSTISELRALGRTGLRVSRIGLGLAALGRPGYINLGHADDLARNYDVSAMESRAHDVFDAAWRSGVRYFDAARSYGRAEEFLASWLASRGIAKDDVTVGSKWGYTYTAGWQANAAVHEVKELSAERLSQQVVESRAFLGSHLGLYQIHSATLASGVLDDWALIARLADLKREGLAIGLTVTGPEQADTVRRAIEIRVGGEPLFDCVQATYNLLERSAGEALAEAHAAGLGVIVKEALANGRLTARGADSVLEATAQRLGAGSDAVALASVLAEPWADVVLSGAATVEHLRSNLTALEVELDERAERELRTIAVPAEAYWTARAAMAWT